MRGRQRNFDVMRCKLQSTIPWRTVRICSGAADSDGLFRSISALPVARTVAYRVHLSAHQLRSTTHSCTQTCHTSAAFTADNVKGSILGPSCVPVKRQLSRCCVRELLEQLWSQPRTVLGHTTSYSLGSTCVRRKIAQTNNYWSTQ